MRSCLNACVLLRHETTAKTIESILAQGRARGKLAGVCWRSLSTKFNHQINKEKDPNATKLRLRVLSDIIPRVLVFVYFCRGVSGNVKERPIRRVYIEILTCRAIFYHLEESRSHGNEREAERARGQGARPPPLGACLGVSANQASPHRLCSTDLRDQGKPCD